MARPRKDQEGPAAAEKLGNAFWEILEAGSYNDVTVRALTERAGVNRNTFYYHFESIEDMAVKLIEDSIHSKFFEQIVSAIYLGDLNVEHLSKSIPNMESCYKRIRMILCKGTPELVGRLKHLAIERWQETLELDMSNMSASKQAKIDFIWGGITAVISSDQATSLEVYLQEIQSGIVDALRTLALQIQSE